MWHEELKFAVERYTGLERDALHIHAALLIYILAMVAFRQSRRSRFPWLVVLFVELANEALDLRNAPRLRPDFPESVKDLWNTMLWPTVLLFIGRYTDLFQHRSRRPAPAETTAADSG